MASPYDAAAHALPPPAPTKNRTVCGCSLLVFILSCIIALLSAAVIGLAAGTGIEAQRANDAISQLATANALLAATTGTPTASGTTPTAVAAGTLDEGCGADPDGVTGTVYTSFGRTDPCWKTCLFCLLTARSSRRTQVHAVLQPRCQVYPSYVALHVELQHVYGRLRGIYQVHTDRFRARRQRNMRSC